MKPIRTRFQSGGFTLVELLVVVAIAGVLVGIIVPTFKVVGGSAAKARELSGARQMMIGYIAYAQDNQGRLMPGYMPGLEAVDAQGTPIADLVDGPAASRYPWRLAPYLDYNFDGLYLDKQVIDGLHQNDRFHYLVSLFPSLGLNCVFVGGTSDEPDVFSRAFQDTFGRVYLARLSQARHPADLIVFASARCEPTAEDANTSSGLSQFVEGFHRVDPPYLVSQESEWASKYDPLGPPADYGHLSMRGGHGCRIGFLDGHTDTLDDGRIRNMKYWADQATDPNWRLVPK
jgi:prepilin-type N-terminal cleavage/methylation domain-containing protein